MRLHKNTKYMLSAVAMLMAWPTTVSAQKERADIRAGNREYHEGKFPEAEVNYKRAIEKNIGSYEANFNLAGALFKQGRYEDAVAIYSKLAQDGTDRNMQASTLYNLGNIQLKQRKLDEAIESYKSSLRLNPDDPEVKFNLAYAQKLKQEEDKKDNQDQNKDQNQDQNQDQNKDQNKDQDKDQNKDQDKQDPGKPKQDPNKEQNQDQQNKPQESQSREESERMLKAIQASEDNTKKKVEKERAEAFGGNNGKQW